MSKKSILRQRSSKLRGIDSFSKRILVSRLQMINTGRLVLVDNEGLMDFGVADGNPNEMKVTIEVLNCNFYSEFVFGGSVAAGEAYMAGLWRCDRLTDLIRILLQNFEILDAVDNGYARLKSPFFRLVHWLNRNTRSGSRRNIGAHYDLGNNFFKLFLDQSMMYSCAYYNDQNSNLDEAAEAKLKRICDKLQLSERDRVVEIGSGWGGFAIYAARRYGCHVTTTTISDEQFAYAEKRIKAEGLQGSITLLKDDYRALKGQFDKLVSIEMIEAVGPQFLEGYLHTCSDLLKPHGIMLIQAITMRDQRYDRAIKSVDFIQRYIFPGGFIPCISAISLGIKKATDLRLLNLEDIGPHYARTLEDWRRRFIDNLPEIRDLGYSDEFIRMWEFYLSYSEGGFHERMLGNVQLVFVKPQNRLNWKSPE
ncbi:MAG: SAM-dependent methyltransferase [Cellvibrionales bacterium TMED49]|nr:SAM-dependent methyltransferase [Porticoccaceae bacterium]OUU35104.1 MAG: SAM-dependent methyltransferase [Cellvibrionales bacterium TMED49]